MDSEAVEALHRARDRARNRFVVAMLLLFVFGGGLGLVGSRLGGAFPAATLLIVLILFAFAAMAEWGWRAWRLQRAADPWRHDPELDGPIAHELEGRSFPPPPPKP